MANQTNRPEPNRRSHMVRSAFDAVADCDCKDGRRPSLMGGTQTCSRCGGFGVIPQAGQAFWYRPAGKYAREAIAYAERTENGWTVRFWDARGPVSHADVKANELMAELRGYFPSATAGRLLDHWATRPAWREGMRQLTLLAYENALRWHKVDVSAAPWESLDGRLAWLASKAREHGITDIW